MNTNASLFGRLLQSDLEEIGWSLDEDLSELKGKKILFFGGTGFIGTWLTTSILYLNELKELDIKLDIVTRSEARAKDRFKGLNCLNHLNFIENDLRKYEKQQFGMYDIFINGATSSTQISGGNDLHSVGNSSYVASRLIEDSARRFLNLPMVVNLSSGSVYQKPRSIDGGLSEQDVLCSQGQTKYESAKLVTEQLLKKLESQSLIKLLNLRLFAFYGPLLELNEHFAVGNFMRDAMARREIVITGSRFTKRSYLYPTDLVVAILKFINKASLGDFNLGGGNPLTMAEVAGFIKEIWQSERIIFASEEEVHPNYYWPDIEKTKRELGKFQSVDFLEGLNRWKLWLNQITSLSQ